MSDEHFGLYEEAKAFLDFTDMDGSHLAALEPVFAKYGGKITDHFYKSLARYPRTAAIIEGRVDALKATHKMWMMGLFTGDYGRSFFDTQYRIGQVHVTNNIQPEFVESVMSILRTEGRWAINEELGFSDDAAAKSDAYVKVLDLCLMTINLAYTDERLNRISKVTGMSRRLIENLVKNGGKRKRG